MTYDDIKQDGGFRLLYVSADAPRKQLNKHIVAIIHYA